MKRLLLVDDDPNLTESAKDILEEAGFTVAAAATLAQARALLAAHAMDILVVDFNLPDGKGPALAQEVKALYPALKMILMTGESVHGLDGESALFHAVLAKPVDPPAFLALLDTLTETPR